MRLPALSWMPWARTNSTISQASAVAGVRRSNTIAPTYQPGRHEGVEIGDAVEHLARDPDAAGTDAPRPPNKVS